ncbi:hypothetical protein U0868_22915 [Kluyvera ascorbata]|uniref:hypothetical protein n=1 Tax=Kluyvera ascorbata TaxID=51288 RepID=UPI002ABB4A00|nr:hypothetical protein [Kluyvera ascorbata]MDZ4034402.1 hypothetical protein [Kluyvera ascorbata]
MDVAINDLSFKGQFQSFDDMAACINTIAKISEISKKLNGNKPLRRTKNLAKRYISNDKTIQNFLYELMQLKDPKLQDLITMSLTNIVQGPFIKPEELDGNIKNTKSICGEIIDGTAIHAYLSKKEESVHAIISAPNSGYDCGIKFTVKIDKDVEKTIFNFMTDACCNSLLRIYQANSKHAILRDKTVGGNIHTRMDLDDDSAQMCLSNGIQIIGSKYVYSFNQGKWYEFPPHTPGCFHGYPIGTPSNLAELNHIIKIFGQPPYSDIGYKFCIL